MIIAKANAGDVDVSICGDTNTIIAEAIVLVNGIYMTVKDCRDSSAAVLRKLLEDQVKSGSIFEDHTDQIEEAK